MVLTLDQMLQQGLRAHNAGNLQEAERLYRAILQVQPKNPDANHNLGLIAVAMNQPGLAMPLFKNAIKVNPNIEQFWLSYIEVLITQRQFGDALRALKKGKKKGVAKENLKRLTQKLQSVKAGDITAQVPSHVELQNLINHYQNEQYGDAENLAILLTQQFPSHSFSWKILGGIYKELGRMTDALAAGKKAVELDPGDDEAHNSKGVIFEELGRFDEAEASYKEAILLKPDNCGAYYNLGNALGKLVKFEEALAAYRQAVAVNPDYAEAHCNLGITLQRLGRLEEAEVSCRRAILLKPDYADAHCNLGVTLQDLGRLGEAEASHRFAIGLKPGLAEAHRNLGVTLQDLGRLDEAEASHRFAIGLVPGLAEAHCNLGVTLQDLGRLNEAEASCRQAILLKPEFPQAMMNLSMIQDYTNNLEAQIISLQNVLQMDADNYGLRAEVLLAIYNFLEGDFSKSKKRLLAAAKIQEKSHPDFKNEKVYQRYLLKILDRHEDKYLGSSSLTNNKNLYVIGESHSLASHRLHVQRSASNFSCKALLVMGCQQWHLGNSSRNQYKNKFESVFCSLPKCSDVLLAIGEIDCRLDSGIIKHKAKYPQKDIKDLIVTTVENYLVYIVDNNLSRQHNVLIQGVPCPNIDTESHPGKNVTELIDVIKVFNFELETKSKDKGFKYLDVHKLTDRGDGFSNAIWHIDSSHLSPDGMLEAWRRYVSKHKYV